MLTVAVVALVGCGGGSGEEPEPTPSATVAATAAPTESPQPAQEDETAPDGDGYRVREGDTLSAIARRFDTTVEELVELNDIDDPNRIRVGQRLKLPGN